jgi:NAD(P)H-dependent flavin oxidoreductase YrpB (nitropropane dioxygenase family)
MEWKTKITDLLGCRYPILQGAMEKLGTWKFAACVAETGAHGTITASISRTPQQLREDIISCRKATGGSFGVNLSIGLCPQIDEMLDVCIGERVPIETSVYKPDALAKRIKESGLPWIHKSARIKDAVHAREQGADAIILVGLEGAGIKSPEQLPTMTTILWGRKKLTVPIIAAGGIGDARGFLGALALGAEGIMMGSAFLATKESPIDDGAKEKIIGLTPDDPELRKRVMTAVRFNRNEDAPAEEKAIDWSQAISFTAGVVDHIPSMQELVESIIQGAESILKERPFLQG